MLDERALSRGEQRKNEEIHLSDCNVILMLMRSVTSANCAVGANLCTYFILTSQVAIEGCQNLCVRDIV